MSWELAQLEAKEKRGGTEVLILLRRTSLPEPKRKTPRAFDQLAKRFNDALRKAIEASPEVKALIELDKRVHEMKALRSDFDSTVAIEANASATKKACETLSGAALVNKLASLKADRATLEGKLDAWQTALAELQRQRQEAFQAAEQIALRETAAVRNVIAAETGQATKALIAKLPALLAEAVDEFTDLELVAGQLKDAGPIERRGRQMLTEVLVSGGK